ncbi:MAG: hypothetical protein ACJATI_004555 [Halioglobus sp.]
MRKLLLIIPLLGISLFSIGQQVSVGLGVKAFDFRYDGIFDSGIQVTASYRAELSGKIQW